MRRFYFKIGISIYFLKCIIKKGAAASAVPEPNLGFEPKGQFEEETELQTPGNPKEINGECGEAVVLDTAAICQPESAQQQQG